MGDPNTDLFILNPFIQGWYYQYMFCNVIACIHMFFNNSHDRGSMAKIMGIYLGGKWREDGGKK